MTGRAAGYCVGAGVPGYMNPGAGRGFGMGFGRGFGMGLGRGRGFGGGGRGWRHRFFATGVPGWAYYGGSMGPYGYGLPQQEPDPEMEKQALKNEAQMLQSELDAIKKRLEDLEAAAEAK